MKKLLMLYAFFCAALPLAAQKVYFIYIESESRSPFYVKMGEQVHSSSSSGYLILSRLPDSTFTLTLGPGASSPELRFQVALKGKDHGFLLKKLNEGWGLFDMQSLELLRPNGNNNGIGNGTRLREDRFTALLSQAAGDTSLLYQPALSVSAAGTEKPVDGKQPIPKPQAVEPDASSLVTRQNTDTVTSPANPMDTAQSKVLAVAPKEDEKPQSTGAIPENLSVESDSAGVETLFKRSIVTRRSESSTVEGFGLVYLDELDGTTDTIRLTIPNAKAVFVESETAPEQEPVQIGKSAPALSCSGQAGEKDFFKLRRNLASVDSETGMTQAAVEAFRRRCFSTAQVKNLSSLFLTQSGKYAFLEASYPYVYDREHFASLQSELFDATYLARFKALTSN